MKTLITGFDPFNGESINPAYEAVKQIPDTIAGCDIIKLEVPTVFGKSMQVLAEAIEREEPDVVICVGQAGGRFAITPEFVAINLDEARIDDNEGNRPQSAPIAEDGENAYFATLPVKAIVKELNDNKIPAEVSYTAGTFVCNHLFYGLMHTINTYCPEIRGGFIHVPYLPEQTFGKKNQPFMTLEMIARGLELAVKATIENNKEICYEVGREH